MDEFRLPDEVIEVCRSLLDGAEAYQWQLGDFLTELVDEFGRQRRAAIIRQLAGQVGADPSTLRDRQVVAEFFDREARDEYPFTWSQFRALKMAGPDHWREHADYWVDNLPAPVAKIRARIHANGHDVPAWVGRWERMLEIGHMIANDEAADTDVRRLCHAFLDRGEKLRTEAHPG